MLHSSLSYLSEVHVHTIINIIELNWHMGYAACSIHYDLMQPAWGRGIPGDVASKRRASGAVYACNTSIHMEFAAAVHGCVTALSDQHSAVTALACGSTWHHDGEGPA
jgi:hypothetical protein